MKFHPHQALFQLNRMDAQLAFLGDKNNPKKSAIAERRAAVDERLRQHFEDKLASVPEGKQPKRREMLQAKLRSLDLPWEERVQAALPHTKAPMRQAQLQFWLDRQQHLPGLPDRQARRAFVEGKIAATTTSPQEAKLWNRVLDRMNQNEKRMGGGNGNGNIQERLVRIQTRLENTQDDTIRQRLERRIAQLQAKMMTQQQKQSSSDTDSGKRGMKHGRRAHRAHAVAQRIQKLQAQLEATNEADQVERLTKRIEHWKQQMAGGAGGCMNKNWAVRIRRVQARLADCTDPDLIEKLQARLEAMKKNQAAARATNGGMKKKMHLAAHIRRVEARLAECTDPDTIEKLQARLETLKEKHQDNMKTGGGGGGGGMKKHLAARIRRVEARLAECTDPDMIEKLQARLETMKEKQQAIGTNEMDADDDGNNKEEEEIDVNLEGLSMMDVNVVEMDKSAS